MSRPGLALLLAPLFFSSVLPAASVWITTSQTDREADVWETRVSDEGFFETFYVPRGTSEADPLTHLTHCGLIPADEMARLRVAVGQLKRRNNGEVKEGHGKGKYPPKVRFYGAKEAQLWQGEKAQEAATLIEDMTHLDPDMGLALAVAEWEPKQVEEWNLDRHGKFIHVVTLKLPDGTSKEFSKQIGIVCRDELRTLRRWMLEATPLIKLAACDGQKAPNYFQFQATFKTKTTTFTCDGPAEKLAPILANAFQQIKLTPYHSQLETK